MALLNTWASQQDQATLSPLDRLLNNYIQQGDAPLAYLMRGDAQGLLKDLNTPKPVNMTQDMTNAALNLNPVMGLIGATAFHGSPAIFNKFDINKLGSGEGSQIYGHGMYFAENPEVAKSYAKSSNLYKVDIPDTQIPKMINWDISLQKQPEVLKTLGVGEKEIARYNAIKKQIDEMPGQYDIDIPKEKAMFDKHTALEKEYNDIGLHKTGQKYYEDLIKKYGSAKNVSEELNKKGITGIKYLDAQSRGIFPRIEERPLTSNYVVFDPSEVKILEKGLLK